MYARENASDCQSGAGATSHTLSIRAWKFRVSLPKKKAFGTASFSMPSGSTITRIAELSGEITQRIRDLIPDVAWFTCVALTAGAVCAAVLSALEDLLDTSIHALATKAASTRKTLFIDRILLGPGGLGHGGSATD
jgi:hypothetical protein